SLDRGDNDAAQGRLRRFGADPGNVGSWRTSLTVVLSLSRSASLSDPDRVSVTVVARGPFDYKNKVQTSPVSATQRATELEIHRCDLKWGRKPRIARDLKPLHQSFYEQRGGLVRDQVRDKLDSDETANLASCALTNRA